MRSFFPRSIRESGLHYGCNSGKLSVSVAARTSERPDAPGRASARRAPRVYAARNATAWRPSAPDHRMSGGGRHTRPLRGKRPACLTGKLLTSRRRGGPRGVALAGQNQ
jgi:hypothetical protein